MRLPLIYYKITKYEYWPFYILYLPLYPYYLWKSLRLGYFFWSTASNPGLDEFGGFFGESKADILKKIPEAYLPGQIFIEKPLNTEGIISKINAKNLNYPLIAKPDVGERGDGVTIIQDELSWEEYLKRDFSAFVVQEYITYPVEMGVFYIKNPENGTVKVTSITLKKFLNAIGDGKSTLGEWVENNTRARFQKTRLKLKFAKVWDKVLAKNEVLLLEPIGNHCLGTEFLSGNHLLSKEIDEIFDSISLSMAGFYYGRFDLKVRSEEDFRKGNTIKIMEFNGISAEPAHIYDKKYTYLKALIDIKKHWDMMYAVCKYNIKHGIKPVGFIQTVKRLNNHFKSKY